MTQAKKLDKKDTTGKQDTEADAAQEMKTLLEQEKDRRLQELPKLRQAD